MNVRFWGAMAAVKYGAALIRPGGSVCLTSGVVSQRPQAGWSLGAALCNGMEGFCRAMAIELAPLRVNIVSPGVVQTNLWNDRSEAERHAFYEAVGNALPVQRVGTAEELAQAYLFLMKQGFMTGQRITVDGGAVLI
jgi:NAD(P)-dependent dehydrogenase (short-subunit alcohol dehydrogenase family)